MTLASYITSIDCDSVAITSGNGSNTRNLGASVTTTNCVPFVTFMIDDNCDDVIRRRYCDVYFTAGSPPIVTLERLGSWGNVKANVQVVEFDGVNVTVQCEQWSHNGPGAISVSFAAVALSRAFAITYYNHDSVADDWNEAEAITYFIDSSTIGINRYNAGGVAYGHTYVVEAQNNEFYTQEISISLFSTSAADNSQSATISAVTMASTWVIGSGITEESADDCNECTKSIYLNDTSNIVFEIDTGTANYSHQANVFVVEFDGSETVQHKSTTWTDTDSEISTSITSVTLAQSIVLPGMHMGQMKYDGTASQEVEGAYVMTYLEDADTVVEQRGDDHNTSNATSWWQVIDFEAGGAPAASAVYSSRGIGRGISRGLIN